jgi:Ca2+-binding RTX toxin-like protein
MSRTVTGTAGDDTRVSVGGDTVFGGAGQDTLVVQEVQSIAFDPHDATMGTVTFLDASALVFSSIETLVNADNRDGLIWGNDSAELIDATYVDGNGDRVDAGDAVYAGAAPDDDDIFALGGDDTIKAGDGRDNAYGGDGNDSVSTDAGDDYAQGDAGNDTVQGGMGDDFLRGDAGFDSVYGGEGNDSVYGGLNEDQVFGGAGDDYTFGGYGNDTVYGGDGQDTMTGSAGDDRVFGGRGDDSIQGSYGGDTLVGGQGADTLLGEDDADVIIGRGGDVVDGGETGDDRDVLRYGQGGVVAHDPGNSENGTVTYADGSVLTFTNIETCVPCFTPGTLIQTDRGEMPVENIRKGDRVLTRDHGYRAVVWVGRRCLSAVDMQAEPHLAPVRIAKGALGPDMPRRDMHVSPQHRLLAQGPRARLLFGAHEVLIPALHLVGYPGITRGAAISTDYIHVMCDAHEVILSDGIWTESFQPGDHTLAGMDAAQRFELETIFVELSPAAAGIASARRTLRRHEADLLLA